MPQSYTFIVVTKIHQPPQPGPPGPGKIDAVRLDHPSPMAHRGRARQRASTVLELSSSVPGTRGIVERPAGPELLASAGGIALVIGTSARRVAPEAGWSHVAAATTDRVPSTRLSTRQVGPARTLRFVPNRGDLFRSHGGGYDAQKRAVDGLRPAS